MQGRKSTVKYHRVTETSGEITRERERVLTFIERLSVCPCHTDTDTHTHLTYASEYTLRHTYMCTERKQISQH